MTVRGTPVVRREDHALLTTGGLFVADRRLAGRAPCHLRHLDRGPRPTCRSVDVPRCPRQRRACSTSSWPPTSTASGPEPLANPQLDPAMRRPLARHRPGALRGRADRRHRGRDGRTRRADAADLVEVDYEPLVAVVDPEAALGPGGAAAVRRDRRRQPGRAPARPPACRPTSTVARWSSSCASSTTGWRPARSSPAWPRRRWEDGRLVHYSAGQGAHPVRDAPRPGLRPRDLRGAGGGP